MTDSPDVGKPRLMAKLSLNLGSPDIHFNRPAQLSDSPPKALGTI